jgi:hypothetical protein
LDFCGDAKPKKDGRMSSIPARWDGPWDGSGGR